MKRGAGVEIIPSRVRQARIERGLSLAALAGDEVSRAFVHQVEHGLSRPSLQVLELIAHRTGKSVNFFLRDDVEEEPNPGPDLASELLGIARRLDRLRSTIQLTEANQAAFRMLAANLRYGSQLVAAVTLDSKGRRRRGPIRRGSVHRPEVEDSQL